MYYHWNSGHKRRFWPFHFANTSHQYRTEADYNPPKETSCEFQHQNLAHSFLPKKQASTNIIHKRTACYNRLPLKIPCSRQSLKRTACCNTEPNHLLKSEIADSLHYGPLAMKLPHSPEQVSLFYTPQYVATTPHRFSIRLRRTSPWLQKYAADSPANYWFC